MQKLNQSIYLLGYIDHSLIVIVNVKLLKNTILSIL